MLKHCSPSSVDLRRRSRRNLDNVNESEDGDTSTHSSSSSGGPEVFALKHVHMEDMTEEELDLCEDVVSVRSFSSQNSSGTTSKEFQVRDIIQSSTSTGGSSSSSVLPKSRIVPRNPVSTSIPLKVYARCLRSDIEYKTLIVNNQTTCRDLIWMLLSKYRMRHRDPKLFYLTMDIYIKRTGIPLKRTLTLEDEARPAELKSCHPWGECKFTLQMRKGGLVRIHDSILMAESKYKCLLISEQTTARDVIKLLFHCYGLEPEPCSSSPNSGSSPGNSVGPGLVPAANSSSVPAGIISSSPEVVDKYCLYEHIPPVQRKLEAEEYPVYVQSQWNQPEKSRLVLRLVEEIEVDAVFARPARIIEVEDHCQLGQDDSMLMHLDTSYCSSGESTASSEFSALRFRDSPMSASSRSNASTDSGLKSSVPVPSSEEEQHRQQQQHNHLHHSQHTHCDSGSSHVLKPGGVDDRLHHPLFKKNSTIITCTHHKGMRCAQMTLTRHYSLSSLLEALPAASVDAEADLEKHASISSLSSGSRYSDYDGYFYI